MSYAKSWKCEECSKKYVYKGNLTNHQAKCHPVEQKLMKVITTKKPEEQPFEQELNKVKNSLKELTTITLPAYKKQTIRLKNRIKNLSSQMNDLQDQVKKMEEKDTKWCLICWEYPTNHAFIPCGHKISCGNCAATVLTANKQCPICRVRIIDIMQIWDVGKPYKVTAN